MSTKPQNVKGMRDLLPPAMMLRQHNAQTLYRVLSVTASHPHVPVLAYAETIESTFGDEVCIYPFENNIC